MNDNNTKPIFPPPPPLYKLYSNASKNVGSIQFQKQQEQKQFQFQHENENDGDDNDDLLLVHGSHINAKLIWTPPTPIVNGPFTKFGSIETVRFYLLLLVVVCGRMMQFNKIKNKNKN